MKDYPLYEVRKISTIKDMINSSCELYADRTAFLKKRSRELEYEPVTYREFGEDINAAGLGFIELGLQKGSKIAIISENRYFWSVCYMAAVNGESIVMPLDRELAGEDLINLLNVSGAQVVVYSASTLKKLKSAEDIRAKVSSLKYAVNMDLEEDTEGELAFCKLIERGRALAKQGDKRFKDVVIDPCEGKILLFTSGTTAMSKGVLLTHKNIATNLSAMCSMVYIDENDVFLSVLPIHHTYECTCGFMAPLYRGSCIAYSDGLRYISKNLIESKATVMLGVPALFEAMYKRIVSQAVKSRIYSKLKKAMTLSNMLMKLGIDKRRSIFKRVIDQLGGNIRMFVSGAAAIDVNTLKAFNTLGIDFLQGYGITECSPIVALTRKECQKADAVGLVMPCMQVKIDNANSEGVGEIICKGENVMLGYFENKEETDRAITDGWFRTGDLGYMDSDGFLYITGRKKNVIVTKNGKNIYPEELEAFINENMYVKESMVYGAPSDSVDGETVISAILVPDMERIESVLGKNPSEDKIAELMHSAVDAVNKRNPLYKYIRNVSVQMEEFKKTTTQKIKRYLVDK